MCKFYSAIVMKNGDVLHNPFTISHEDIIDEYNLNDNKIGNFVRVEFSPTSGILSDLDSYKLLVDESEIPEWFESYRNNVIQKLYNIVKNMIITEQRNIICGKAIILCEGANINIVKNSLIHEMRGNAQVNAMWENAQVNEMLGNAQVNAMWENARVNKMFENAQVNEMWGNAQVNEMFENAQVNEMWGNAQVNAMWENAQVNAMWENAQVNEMFENAQVNEMWGNAQVNEMWGNAQVNAMWENAQIINKNNAK